MSPDKYNIKYVQSNAPTTCLCWTSVKLAYNKLCDSKKLYIPLQTSTPDGVVDCQHGRAHIETRGCVLPACTDTRLPLVDALGTDNRMQ